MKAKLFTHTDLDGVGCAILMRVMLDDDVDVTYCDYHNVNSIISDFILSSRYEKYTHIFITDISVNENVAKRLDEIDKSEGDPNIFLLDHHSTAAWLQKEYDWAIVKPAYDNGIKTAGVNLVYDYFNVCHPDILSNYELSCFTEIVRRYDTWDWNRMNDIEPKRYNDLLGIIGRDRFMKKMIPAIKIFGNRIYLDEQDMTFLEINQEKIDRYIDKVNKKMMRFKIDGYNAGVVFYEQFTSELGNELCKRNPDIDFVIMLNMHYETYSLRTVREDIHLGELSNKLFGGGGHPQAAGAQLSKEQVAHIANYLIRDGVSVHA